MITRLLDKLLRVEKQPTEETAESIKREIMVAKTETVESIQKMNRLIQSRSVTFDIHIATGGNST